MMRWRETVAGLVMVGAGAVGAVAVLSTDDPPPPVPPDPAAGAEALEATGLFVLSTAAGRDLACATIASFPSVADAAVAALEDAGDATTARPEDVVAWYDTVCAP